MHPVSQFEAIELIRTWGRLFDAHASPHTVYHYTAGEDFTIRFGDTELKGLAGLEEHHPLKEVFFNEIHHYYNFQVISQGTPLVMQTQMVWDTQRRLENGSHEHLIADLRHQWTFIRNSQNQPVFLEHELLELNYRQGYSPSETKSANLHLDPNRVGFNR